jgi:hypothetical protein
MNQSIYLMVSVPYLTLGVGAFLVWRGLKKNAIYLAKQREMEVDPHAAG